MAAKTKLAAPTGLKVIPGATATVSYTETEGANLYVVYYSTDATFATYRYVTSTTGTAEAEGLAHGRTYYFKVQARDTSGNFTSSDFSGVKSVVSNQLETPGIVQMTVSGTSVTLRCDKSDGANRYVVYYSTDADFQTYRYALSTTSTVTATGLTLGETYYFKVQARDTTGTYAASRFSEVRTAVTTHLGTPENLKVKGSGTTAAVTYNETPEANRYVIYYSTDSTFATYRYALSTTGQAAVTGLTLGETYYFQVQARDTTGNYISSRFSEVKSVTLSVLAAPQNLTVTISGTTAALTYDQSLGANRYVVYFSTDPTFATYRYHLSDSGSATVRDLTPNKTYYFQVQARDTTGIWLSSDFSEIKSAETGDELIDVVMASTASFTDGLDSDWF